MKIKVDGEEFVPTIGAKGDAGYDLRCTEDVVIPPGTSYVVSTGVYMSIPFGYYGLLVHRSSLAFKGGSVLSTGIIDSNFKGEIKAYVLNHGSEYLYLKKGDRFCQIIFNRYYEDKFEIEEDLEDGKEGFGSSGTN
jgi:dUTP pyrophosphatase